MSAPPNKWAVLAIVGIGVFMATLDASIVNISLPAIARSYHVPIGGPVEWVIISYLVVVAALLLTAGRLSDLVGQRAVWVTGLVVFTGGSVVCGAATSLAFLVAARGLQGVGGALLMAVSPAMLTRAFPTGERGRALGLNAVVVAAGISAGPTLGGIITDTISWRWIFFVNVPVGVVGVVATLAVLPHEPNRAAHRFDPAGAALLALAFGALTGGLSFAGELGGSSPVLWLALVAGAGALAALVVVERRVAHPALDLNLFKNRVFSSATASLVLSFLALFAVPFLLPFYLEQLRGFPAEKAGLLMTPLPLTIALVSPLSGRLSDRIGTRPLAATGLAIGAGALAWLATLDADSSVAAIVARCVVAGFGQALFQPPNNSALMGAAPRERQGVASGVLATGRVMGQALSVALAGAIFGAFGGREASRALGRGARDAHLVGQFLGGFRAALIVCACVAVVGVFASLVRGKDRPTPSEAR